MDTTEHLKRAEQCRELAAQATTDEHRQTLLKMAGIWKGLAHTRNGRAYSEPKALAVESGTL